MVIIEVKNAEVRNQSGIDKKGRPYSFRKQSGYLDVGKDYPVEVSIDLRPEQPPFAPGRYTLTASCFYVARFGQPQLDLTRMVPVK